MRSLTLMLVVLVGLTGCIPDPKPNLEYAAYAAMVDKQAEDERARFASMGAAAASCDTDDCRERIASNMAIVIAASGGSGGRAQPQQFRKQYHPAWGIVGNVATQVIPGYTSIRASDNAAETTLGLYGLLGGVVEDVSQSPALQSPNITVGGHYVQGDQHIGDAVTGDYVTGQVGDAVGGDWTSAGRDNIAGDQHVGDAVGRDAIGRDQHVGDAVGRDAIGRDRNTDSNIGNDNRQDSDGPFDNDIDNGDRCEGERCQGDGLPVTEPDPGGPVTGPRPPGG